jgi:hypothetical protein
MMANLGNVAATVMMANVIMTLPMIHLANMVALHWWPPHTPVLHLPHMNILEIHRS